MAGHLPDCMAGPFSLILRLVTEHPSNFMLRAERRWLGKPRLRTVLAMAVCLFLLCSLHQGARGQDLVKRDLSPMRVTPEILKSKIAETETAAHLSDEIRTELINRYRQAASNLAVANENSERAAAFERAAQSAPAETKRMREEIEAAENTPAPDGMPDDTARTLDQSEQQLLKEQAESATAVARHEDLERRIAGEEDRPAAIRQLLQQGTDQQKVIAAALQASSDPEETAEQTQAGRWVLETRSAVRSTEVTMLNQELRSRPMRLDLLKAELDQAGLQVEQARTRVETLTELVQRRRQLEAEQARNAASEAQRQAAGLDPVLTRLADENAELTDELNEVAGRLDVLRREKDAAASLADRITADHQDARETLETSGLTSGLGHVLLASKRYVPNIKECRRNVRAREEDLAQAKVRQLRHREEARWMGDTETAVATLAGQFAADETPELMEQLRKMVRQRLELLEQVTETDATHLAQLIDALAAERRLADAAENYGDFLNANLLWLGDASPLRPSDLLDLQGEMRRIMAPDSWLELAEVIRLRAARVPLFWLALLVAGILQWKRRPMIDTMKRTATLVAKPRSDQFAYTLQALALTLGLAVPLSMVVAGLGGLLRGGTIGNDASLAVGATLLRMALHLFLLRFWSVVCRPSGLGVAHFRWPESSVSKLRRELRWLTWILLPAMLLVRLAVDLNPSGAGGTVVRLLLPLAYGSIAWFLYTVLHPRRGVLAARRPGNETRFVYRTYRLWFPLLLACPLGLIGLAVTGYMYSLAALGLMFLYTVWLLAGLVLLRALALRWLLVVQRRLAFEAALERRAARATDQSGEAAEEGVDGSSLHTEEPEVDLAALSQDTRELTGLVVIVAGLVGLFLIWAPALPALRFFDEIHLPHLPVTLADIVLALVFAFGTAVVAKRIPALLEIILLRRSDLSAGSRYAVTTLFNYAIVFAGGMMVLRIMRVEWSQLQWLVAALGVGIGFGLQEIVANFISGLIILFERPVRVGDIVTVGDTDGVVTKIRIRATTIRNWDRKELLVPNKEFITGRLLNWTLSDQVTRIMVGVGVAYGSDVEKALELMKEAAEEHEQVLDDPAPVLTFEGFGDNALTLNLRAYLGSLEHRLPTISDLHRAINRKFNQAGIVIAFPQRDVHLDTSRPLRISLDYDEESERRAPRDADDA